jgi:hypothetical protein
MAHSCGSRIRQVWQGPRIRICVRELRVQSGGRPLRIFYAFDPRRTAILLVGGDKTGDERFYETFIPEADRLYDEYVDELRREGLIT